MAGDVVSWHSQPSTTITSIGVKPYSSDVRTVAQEPPGEEVAENFAQACKGIACLNARRSPPVTLKRAEDRETFTTPLPQTPTVPGTCSHAT